MLRSLSLAFLLIAACGGSDKPATTTANTADRGTTDQTRPCETPVDGPMSSDQCTCQHGTVRPDPGNGSVKCDAGERELGRVSLGMEGGLCCAPAEAPP